MKWPRGRYNGWRIVGVDVRVRVDLTWWSLDLPGRWGGCYSIGPLHVWFNAAYESAFDAKQAAAGDR